MHSLRETVELLQAVPPLVIAVALVVLALGLACAVGALLAFVTALVEDLEQEPASER